MAKLSTKPRVSSAVEGQPPHMVSALLHQPELAAAMDRLYRISWGSGSVSMRVKEVARIRNARVVNCAACQNVRIAGAQDEGLVEDIVADISNDYESSELLTDQEKAALRLTDALLFDPSGLTGADIARLHEQFTSEQIAELALEVAKLGAVAKLIITMGMEPAEPPNALVVPTPDDRNGLLGQDELQRASS